MNIIAFPFAGGSVYSYNFLKPLLDQQGISLHVIEYKGRGNRIQEPLMYSLNEIVEDVFQKVVKCINNKERYIIYGHSMGALVGYLICHKIEKLAFNSPIKLIVSGRKGPSRKIEKKIADYPNDLFWEEVINFGGVSSELEQSIELRDFFEPVLKADFKSIESYVHSIAHPLSISIDVFYGDQELKEPLDFLSWEKESVKEVKVKSLPGNHFFIYEYAEVLTNHFIQGFQDIQ